MKRYTAVSGTDLHECVLEVDRLAELGWRLHTYSTYVPTLGLDVFVSVEHVFILEN